jgi:hypothetical protein
MSEASNGPVRYPSGVRESLIGRNQEIEIGPMSGSSNVIFYLSQRGIVAS